jgi:hypothetical protein
MCLKEWSGVCHALVSGRQSLILRKGGIAEESGQFEVANQVFWLYPTRVHEAQQGLKAEPSAVADELFDPHDSNHVPIRALAAVAQAQYVEREGALEALEPLHVWTAGTVRKRFHYRRPGLWVLGVRIYLRSSPLMMPITPAHAGCKSWVALDTPMSTAELAPVVRDEMFEREMSRIRDALRPERETGGERSRA